MDGVLAAWPDGDTGVLTVWTTKDTALTEEAATKAIGGTKDMKLRRYSAKKLKQPKS